MGNAANLILMIFIYNLIGAIVGVLAYHFVKTIYHKHIPEKK